MPRPRDVTDLPETKACDWCGSMFRRPRRKPMGPIAHTIWARRRYCGETCRRSALGARSHCASVHGEHPASKGDQAGVDAGRARARKLYPDLGACERCPSPATLRHHRDEDTLNNEPENIEFLCRPCHTAHHAPEQHRRDRVAA